MPIDFDSGGIFGKRRSTKQFELEKEDIITVSHDFSGATEETVYTVTTGKTFWITDVLLIFKHSSAVNFDVKFDDNLTYTAQDANTTVHVVFQVPFPLTSAKTIKATGGHADNFLTVIGYETA